MKKVAVGVVIFIGTPVYLTAVILGIWWAGARIAFRAGLAWADEDLQ